MRNVVIPGGICVVLVFVLAAGCISTGPSVRNMTTTPYLDPASPPSPDDIRAFVLDAGAFARAAGREAAVQEFSKENGIFSGSGRFIYAYDSDGTLLADPTRPGEVGRNRMNATDFRGLHMIAIGNYTASHGGGYISYLTPADRRSSPGGLINGSFIPKIDYVFQVDPTWWIGSGIPVTELGGADPVPVPIREMTDLEQRGAAYGRKYGKDAAFEEISNRSGMFVDPAGHYLTGYDYNGTVLSHPYLPEAVGKSLITRKDRFGMEIVRSASDTARSGGGYVVFVWPNPGAGNRDELKIGYMLPVDDTWWIGSGAYLSEITGVQDFL